MLRVQRFRMLESLEGLLDVAFHGEVDVTFFVMPVEVHSAVFLAFPVFSDYVVLLECINKVMSAFVGKALDSEIVDCEAENDVVIVVFEKAWGDSSFFVACNF